MIIQLSLLCLSFCAALKSVVASVPPPGEVLDFSTFDALQIPVESDSGSIVQIRHPELDSYSSKYMYTDEWDTSKVVMWAPINGFKTGNGAGPRTELTEPNDYFTFSGKHTMRFTQQVKEVSGCSDVCIGQIKGDSFDELFLNSSRGIDATADGQIVEGKVMGGSCLIVVELMYDASDKRVVAHTRDEDCNNVNNDMGHYDLDEEIHIEMEVDDYNVYISSDKVSTKRIDYSHWKGAHYGMHFKVGVYDQCEGSTSTKGSKSKLSNLKIAHSG